MLPDSGTAVSNVDIFATRLVFLYSYYANVTRKAQLCERTLGLIPKFSYFGFEQML